MSIALLAEDEKPTILFNGSSKCESDNLGFVQVLSGLLKIPEEKPISVGAALTLNNHGCSLFVKQSGENILNTTSGVNYPLSINLKLKGGNYIYISIDVSDELVADQVSVTRI